MNKRKAREARIAELRTQCQTLGNEVARLETQNEREDAAPWIGKCFKYRNRDSQGKAWWLYLRVLQHDAGTSFYTLQCQSQAGGWHIVTTRDRAYLLPDPKARGFIQISRREFNRVWRQFTKRLEGLNR